jgi:16S rRNA (uracil1498-N3)-methyltransferase
MVRLFVDFDLPGAGAIVLSQEDSHYITTLMHMKVGDEVHLFNGRDGEWKATIGDIHKRKAAFTIGEQVKPQGEEPDLWLVFALIKKPRIDFMVQKATEMGVSRLVPVFTKYTKVDRVKTERLYVNAKEAAEQCERMMVPIVDEPQKLNQLLANWPNGRQLMFCDEDLSGKPVLEKLSSLKREIKEPWAILIGPEGGFSADERDRLNALDFTHKVSLGPRVLRADTAAIAALALWQSALGDWGGDW